MTNSDNVVIAIRDMRLEQWQKRQLQTFANLLKTKLDCDCQRVEFAKQDSRGSLSITIFDSRHCISMQKHFINKQELLGFIDGYLASQNPYL